MSTFLNLSLDGKVNSNFLVKHILFSSFWIIGIMQFIFRIDILILQNYSSSLQWLRIILPTCYFLGVVIMFYFLKWYYIIGFIFYPLLLVFWFIPKTILRRGKVYLLGNYLSFIVSRVAQLKRTVFVCFLLTILFILFITISENWIKWVMVLVLSYFYFLYLVGVVKKSFQRPALFGEDLEQKIKGLIQNKRPEGSLVKTFIVRKEDEKLELAERKEKQKRRSVIAHHVIAMLTVKINSFQGRKAFIILWIYSALFFLFFSVVYFWFLNYQLYRISASNFIYQGDLPLFDFFYYTLKTITFGDIELVKPVSVLARISEVCSFFTIGIFILIIFVSVMLSLWQDKMNENVKLATALFENENLTLVKYFEEEFGMELKLAMGEVKNIDDFLKRIKNTMDRFF